MPTEGLIGTDALSTLKEAKWLFEAAIEDFEQYKRTLDSAKLLRAAERLTEVEEWIGGYKLALIVEVLKHRADQHDKK